MKGLAVVLALEAVASAQPQPDAEPVEPAPAEPAPAEPAPPTQPGPSASPAPTAPPVSTRPPGAIAPLAPTTPAAHDKAVLMTRAAHDAAARKKCELVEQLGTRVRELDAAYYDHVFASDTTIAWCRPDVPVRVYNVAGRPEPKRQHFGFTVEGGVGLGAFGGQNGAGIVPGGPAVGVGTFVTPNLALSVRVSGAWLILGYFGQLGPNAQLWVNDNIFVGGGPGLGFFGGCSDGCGGGAGIGVDGRLGYAVSGRGWSGATISVEAVFVGIAHDSDLVASVLVGYQAF